MAMAHGHTHIHLYLFNEVTDKNDFQSTIEMNLSAHSTTSRHSSLSLPEKNVNQHMEWY